MTKIIVDSVADLPDEIMKKYDIGMLPLRILINDIDYKDKVTIKVHEVYAEMKKGICPQTSTPNAVDIYELFHHYAAKGIDFIFYSFSAKLSSTHENASLVIEQLREQFPDRKMKAIDTKSGALAQGIIALQGAKLLEAGKSFEEVVRISEQNAENIEHIFSIDDLNWLLKGGRISKTEAVLGGALKIKPVVDLDDGEMQVIKKVRGRKKSLQTVFDLLEERIKDFPNQIIGIAHAEDLAIALEMKDMIVERFGEQNILVEKIGGVLGTHLGLGGVGVFFLNKEPDIYINEL